MNKQILGNRIREARNLRGYSLDVLASAVGINKSTLSRYEKGLIENPKLPVIESIGIQLHTNPKWLLGESEDRTYSPMSSRFALRKYNNLFSPIRNLRLASGISIEDAAYKIGISKSDYLAIESGHNTDCITLARIADFYCCSTDFALSYDGVICEEEQLQFSRTTLMRLHHIFYQLTSEDQEKVINYATSLLPPLR